MNADALRVYYHAARSDQHYVDDALRRDFNRQPLWSPHGHRIINSTLTVSAVSP